MDRLKGKIMTGKYNTNGKDNNNNNDNNITLFFLYMYDIYF